MADGVIKILVVDTTRSKTTENGKRRRTKQKKKRAKKGRPKTNIGKKVKAEV